MKKFKNKMCEFGNKLAAKYKLIGKLKEFLATHESIRQLILFTLFSLICFAIEYVSFAVVLACLKNYNESVTLWIFHYSQSAGGRGALIAFFVSNVLAQIATFVLNRKNTFKSDNNLLISGIGYAITVCGIIILNTWAGGAITAALNKKIDNLVLCQYIGKFAGSFMSFVISFVMNKFVIMRDWSGKHKAVAADEEEEEVEEKAV